MDTVVPIRLDKFLVDSIDTLVSTGLFRNRNEGIREGIRALIMARERPHRAVRRFASQVIANVIMATSKDVVEGVVLFGSVARGDDERWSDVDLLVITTGTIDYDMRLAIVGNVQQLLTGTDIIPSLHFMDRQSFVDEARAGMPFARDVVAQGHVLAGAMPVIKEVGARGKHAP